MEAVAAVGEAFLSTMFEVLRDKLNALDLMSYAPKKKVFRKWEKKWRTINAVLADAEEKQVMNRSVKIWLKELQDLAHDIKDVLDEFDYEALRRESSAKKNCLRGLKWSGVAFNVKTAPKIKEITKRLDEIATEKNINNLGLGDNVGGKAYKAGDPQRQPTTSVVSEVNVFGRKNEKETILNLLLAEQESDDGQVPVMNITGMSGIGKTTLAQLVYNDGKVKDFFDLKAWIHVPEVFDVMEITKRILHAVVNPRSTYENNDLDLLQLKLKEELSGKKFLLVLDDVWHQEYDEWSLLIRPFEVKNSVCKIIVTTQNQSVSQVTGTLPAHPLKELADDDCLSILARHALKIKNFDGYPRLKEIGKEIVKKCKGLPLAVIALASLLRNKLEYKEWEDVSRSEMWDLIGENKGIVAALGLSYYHLPPHLKPCFAYCSLIPKGYEFTRDELVLLWIAEDLVQPEDLGSKYFSDLLSRSFFQQSNGNKSLFVMHDLIIDLAQSVAGDFYFNMEHEPHVEDGQHYSKTARHVSFIPHQYDVSRRFEIFYKMKCPRMRSFISLPKQDQEGYCYLSSEVLQELLLKLECLRVLSLSGYFIEELPSSIGDLKHLRSLNLSKTAIRLLPQSVGTLYHLKMLILKQCKELTALPVEICGLSKLCRLDIRDTPKLQELPSGLGNLISLRILPQFIIGKAGGLAIKELKNLSLQGQLSITGLHNVVDTQDARIANIRQKQGLKELDLKWSNDCKKRDNQMKVLEALYPPKNLIRLSISYYGATQFPSWVGNPSFGKVEQIDLFDCINCKSLPSFGRLPLLKSLNIRGMHAMTEFYADGFPSLETLKFEDMPEWKEWNSTAGNVQGFPLLHELTLHNCPKLAGTLPSTIGSLVKIDVQNCPRLMNLPSSFSS